MRAKPDITGQRFGRLVCLGKGKRRPDGRGSYRQYWRFQCDCGKIAQVERGSVELKGQISCGCARRLGLIDNKRRPLDISGQKFGTLTAIRLTGKKCKHGKPLWEMKCACGKTVQMSLSHIRRDEYYGNRINCKDRGKHPERFLTYPPTPNPYPKEAGRLLEKYLGFTKLRYTKVDSQVEDEKLDRLIRACWIITYRRQIGEYFSEIHERRFLAKHLKYCSIDVFWKRKLEQYGGFLYNQTGKKKSIGKADMTFELSLDYPEVSFEGIKPLSREERKVKVFKFKRR